MRTSTAKKKKYYKVLSAEGRAPIRHDVWSLPVADFWAEAKPGMWHTVTGKIVPCRNGLHVVATPRAIAYWLGRIDRRLFACDVRGEVIQHGRGVDLKYACRTVRLTHEVTRGSAEWKKALRGTSAENWS